jgi:hypothetical protein
MGRHAVGGRQAVAAVRAWLHQLSSVQPLRCGARSRPRASVAMMCQGGAIGRAGAGRPLRPGRARTVRQPTPSRSGRWPAASGRTRARGWCPARAPLGAAGRPADPAPHRVGWYGQLGPDRPVALAAGAGQQRLSHHVDRVRVARRGLGGQQDVRDRARPAPHAAWPQRGTPATGQAQRASPGEAPLPQRTGAARTAQHRGSQVAVRLSLVEHHDHALRLPASVDLRGFEADDGWSSGSMSSCATAC